MVLITFDIDWTDGTKKQITFEDDMIQGDFAQIMDATVDLSDVVSGKVKININKYVSMVLQKSIRSAPFNPNEQELNKLGKKLYDSIVSEVLKHYPLGKSLEPLATAMLGDAEQVKSLIESMPSVQANSGGINAQLITNQ